MEQIEETQKQVKDAIFVLWGLPIQVVDGWIRFTYIGHEITLSVFDILAGVSALQGNGSIPPLIFPMRGNTYLRVQSSGPYYFYIKDLNDRSLINLNYLSALDLATQIRVLCLRRSPDG